jgi:ribose-phosphate pyrophosphokinase
MDPKPALFACSTLFSGRANKPLADKVAAHLGMTLGRCSLEDFPDDEMGVIIQADIQNHDVYVLQPTCPPVAANLFELLLVGDAARRAGALRLTALIPYYGYARQDRRVTGQEPVSARLVADLLRTRFERFVAVDLHNPAIEGFFDTGLVHLSAVPELAAAVRTALPEKSVLVAPDLGAVKLAQRYADRLALPIAYIHKARYSGQKVRVLDVIGEVRGRAPVVVDDMISTGGTMVSAIRALLSKGCLPQVTIVASHTLLAGDAVRQLADLPVSRIFTTDSVALPTHNGLPIEVVGLHGMLAETIQRLRSPEG